MISGIPVEGNPGHRPLQIPVPHHGAGSLQHLFLVVIPDQQPQPFIQAVPFQRRQQMKADKLRFLFSAVNAAVPGLNRLWLVLNGQKPHVHAAGQAMLRVTADVFRPQRRAFLPQEASPRPALIGFHPGRRSPGREHELQGLTGCLFRIPKERQQILLRPCIIHFRKLRILRIVIRRVHLR